MAYLQPYSVVPSMHNVDRIMADCELQHLSVYARGSSRAFKYSMSLSMNL